MADATTPVLVHPRTTLTTKLTEMKYPAWRLRKYDKGTKIAEDLEDIFVDDTEIYKDEAATVDTSAAGEFWIDMQTEITTLLARINFECLSLDEGFLPYAIGDYYVLTGTIASGPLTRFEVLTLDDSSATLVLAYGASLADGAGKVIIARLTSGTITVADAVATGGSSAGTLTFTAGAANLAGGANNRCPGIGGRLQVLSTGLADASQTSEPVSYLVEGVKA